MLITVVELPLSCGVRDVAAPSDSLAGVHHSQCGQLGDPRLRLRWWPVSCDLGPGGTTPLSGRLGPPRPADRPCAKVSGARLASGCTARGAERGGWGARCCPPLAQQGAALCALTLSFSPFPGAAVLRDLSPSPGAGLEAPPSIACRQPSHAHTSPAAEGGHEQFDPALVPGGQPQPAAANGSLLPGRMRQEPAATSLSTFSPSSGSRAPGPGQAVALLRALRAPHLPPDALLGKPGP